MFKFSRTIILLLVTISLTTRLYAEEQNKRYILGILPFSGPQAKLGTAIRNGLELALTNSNIKLKLEDDKGKPAEAASIFQTETNLEPPSVVVILGSPPSLAIAQKSQDKGIPMISIATSEKIQEGRPYVFRHMSTSSTMAKLVAGEMKKRSIKKVGTITTVHDGMISFQNAFKAEFGLPTVIDEEVSPEESDFRTSALNLIRRTPEAIFITLAPPQSSLFAKSIRNLGYKGLLFSANQIDDASERQAAGTAFEGLIFARDGDGSESREKFNRIYFEKYKEEYDSFAANGYDVGLLIKKGLDSGDLVKSLNSTKEFKGSLGTYSILPTRAFDVPGSLWTIKDGKLMSLY